MVTEKERLLSVLDRRKVDRPPVVIPGGMMNGVTVEVMRSSGYTWPKAHTDAEFMAGLALATRQQTGIENVGVPFCMTVEAEAMGSQVDLGSERTEPHIKEFSEIGNVFAGNNLPGIDIEARKPVVLDSVARLKTTLTDVPILGNIVGPMSLAASIVDPQIVLRMVQLNQDDLERLLDMAVDYSISFAREQIDQGADVIVIGDPTGTGEILGASSFTRFEVPRLQKLVSAVHDHGAKIIVHICGNIHPILEDIQDIGMDALSFDAMVNIKKVRQSVGPLPLMGNISTVLLHQGTPDRIKLAVREAITSGIDIVSPACGFSPFTPLINIQAMCQAVKETCDEQR